MNNQRFNYPTIITATRDLPVGLLGRAIIQHLPWGKRVQVEGVCRHWQRETLAYGWEDVKHLEWGEESGGVHLQPTSWMPLLSRLGPHLVTLNIEGAFGLSEKELLAGLVECPKLRHLSMAMKHLARPVFDHICRTYASTLKSFQFRAHDCVNPGATILLNELLSCLITLEYLCVKGKRCEVKLETASLSNIRHLSLEWCDISQGSFEGLAALSSLRSLKLWRPGGSAEELDLSALQRFPHLEHLCVEVSASNVQSFIEALPHLGASLKALQLQEDLSIAALKEVFYPIAAHLRLLEHLELWMLELDQQEELLQLPRVKSLRSLSLLADATDWGWLERICQEHPQLEYLELYDAPPLSTLCSILRACKSLSVMQWPCSPDWEAADLVRLLETTAATATTEKSYGNVEELKGSSHLPSLCIAFEGAESFRDVQIGNSLMLRFTSQDKSQVLYQHRYGCLSEGRPMFVTNG